MAGAWALRIRSLFNLGQSTGTKGEAAAAKYLKGKAYRILARNLRNRYGEIDLLAEAPDKRTVVIVEVKSAVRKGQLIDGAHDELAPEHRVGRAKQHKITALASQIVRRYALDDRPIRFDVIGVSFFDDGQVDIRHYPGAFEVTI
jgi:putative endonuclease